MGVTWEGTVLTTLTNQLGSQDLRTAFAIQFVTVVVKWGPSLAGKAMMNWYL